MTDEVGATTTILRRLVTWTGWRAEGARIIFGTLPVSGVVFVGWWTLAVTVLLFFGTIPLEMRWEREYLRRR